MSFSCLHLLCINGTPVLLAKHGLAIFSDTYTYTHAHTPTHILVTILLTCIFKHKDFILGRTVSPHNDTGLNLVDANQISQSIDWLYVCDQVYVCVVATHTGTQNLTHDTCPYHKMTFS